MHSLKNTFVAVVLLGVSYFVYNGLTNPAAIPESDEPGVGLNLEMPDTEGAGITGAIGQLATDTQSKIEKGIQDFSNSFANPTAPPLKQSRVDDLSQTQPLQRDLPRNDLAAPQRDFRSQDFQSPSHFSDSNTQPQNPSSQIGGGQFQPNKSQPESETELGPIVKRAPLHRASTVDTVTGNGNDMLRQMGHTDSGGGFTSTAATLEMAWPKVDGMVNKQNYRGALAELSQFYDADNVPASEQTKLLEWLDALAGKVIYSSEHNLETSAYVIRANDTIQSIADQWGVPAQLVYNVNQAKISNPLTLTPGNELKIIRGPFAANIDTNQSMLTLFLDNLYAGRFEIRVLDPPAPGQYRVSSKIADGGTMGSFQVELTNAANGSKCSLHAASAGQGSIGLTLGDAQDLYGILSSDSIVTVR